MFLSFFLWLYVYKETHQPKCWPFKRLKIYDRLTQVPKKLVHRNSPERRNRIHKIWIHTKSSLWNRIAFQPRVDALYCSKRLTWKMWTKMYPSIDKFWNWLVAQWYGNAVYNVYGLVCRSNSETYGYVLLLLL